MTAAALCDALQKEDGMHSEVELVAAITRTQSIVTLGNLLGRSRWPVARPLHSLENRRFFSVQRSRPPWSRIDAPAALLTIPFAALTGCFLWFSSLFAGWTANWMVLNRLPAAIAQSRKIRWSLGAEAALELAQIVKHHFSGVAGYVCLGLMLGLLPFVSVFAGLPVEVRHITLASASVAYDVSSLAWTGKVPWPDLCWAGIGCW